MIEERPPYVTYYSDSGKTIVTRPKVLEDGTIVKMDEDISSRRGIPRSGGIQSTNLTDYLDNVESKDKERKRKDKEGNSSNSN